MRPGALAVVVSMLLFASGPLWAYDPEPLLHWVGDQTPASPVATCVGTAVHFAVDFYPSPNDLDSYGDPNYPVDGPVTVTWTHTGTSSWVPSGDNKSADAAWDTAGTYTVKCKINDPGVLANDPDVAEREWTVSVCGITLTPAAPYIKVGCGWPPPQRLFVTFGASQGCPSGEPQWSVQAPLVLEWHGQMPGEQAYKALVRVDQEPAGCEDTGGSVTAALGGCSKTVSIPVKKFGPFSLTPSGNDPTQCYSGEVTFAEVPGLPVPNGCLPISQLYGCVSAFYYTFCCYCPLPGATELYETLEAGGGCVCRLGDPARNPLAAGWQGCKLMVDYHGIVACSCFDPVFWAATEDCKIRQSYKVGECELYKQCVHQVINSPTNTCIGLTQTVTVAPGWDNCDCYGPP